MNKQDSFLNLMILTLGIVSFLGSTAYSYVIISKVSKMETEIEHIRRKTGA